MVSWRLLKSPKSDGPSRIVRWCSIVDYILILEHSTGEVVFKLYSARRFILNNHRRHRILIIRLSRYPHTLFPSILPTCPMPDVSLPCSITSLAVQNKFALPYFDKKKNFCHVIKFGSQVLAKCDQRSRLNGYIFAKLCYIGKIPPTLILGIGIIL